MATKRRKSGTGFAFGQVLLYGFASVGAFYLGAQAYARISPPAPARADAQPKERAQPAAAPSHPTRRSEARPERSAEREEPEKPAEKEQAPAVAVKPVSSEEHLPGVEIDRANTGRPEVALTFDAGSDWRPAKKILDTLHSEGVKSTFFLTGEWVKQNPKTTSRITDEGHELGNHSWSHTAFTELSEPDIMDELDRTEAIIRETTGKSSKPYFRPPLGARDDRVRRIVGENGYLSIYWSIDSLDSVRKGITAQEIEDRVLEKVAPGTIVLMHCGSQATADALPNILAGLKERGLQPVPVSKLLTK